MSAGRSDRTEKLCKAAWRPRVLLDD